jgi:hypothetical protein
VKTTGKGIVVVAWLFSLPLVTPNIRGADEIEYFAYLHSMAFDGDLEFGNEYRHFYARDPEGLAGFAATFLDRREPLTGRHINFAPLGSALLWSPFYLLAHLGVLLARAAGSAVLTDGFSAPYVAAACYASWLYGGLGLLLIHDALRRFAGASDVDAGWAAATLLWASPLLYYMTIAPGFSHATSVFAVAALVWTTLHARDLPRRRSESGGAHFSASRSDAGAGLMSWMAVGALGGIAALVREQDALFLAVPLGLLAADAARTGKWGAAAVRAAVTVATAVAVFVPQLLAYRAINGAFGPSRLVTRKMTYTSPHFLEVLLDPGHGLFVWAPVLLVATVALAAAAIRRRDVVSGVLLLALLLQVWINGSVESWTQAGAFGSRRFVGATVVFAWGLAVLVAALRGRFGPTACAAFLVLLAWWNVSLMVQFGLRLMDRQRLEWPRVAVNQVTEVPPRAARAAWLFLTDRERLVRETR